MTAELSADDLHAALVDLLSRPKPRVITWDLADVDLDWEQLRLLVRIKLYQRQMSPSQLAQQINITDTALARFLRLPGKQLEVRTVLRLMVWIGFTDFAHFLKDTDKWTPITES